MNSPPRTSRARVNSSPYDDKTVLMMNRRSSNKFTENDFVLFCQKVIKLRAEGLTDRIISERMGVSRTTVVTRMKRYRDRAASIPASLVTPLESNAPLESNDCAASAIEGARDVDSADAVGADSDAGISSDHAFGFGKRP